MALKKKKSYLLTLSVALLAAIGYLIYHYGYMVYQEYDYYTYYENINGLQRSSAVYINGVRVGEISDIDMEIKEKVKVTMSIKNEIEIPKGSIALLASKGLLGERMILLQTTNNQDIYTHKDEIVGKYDTSVMEMSDQIEPIIESTKYILETADKNFVNFNKKLDNGWVKQTQKDVAIQEQNMNKYQRQAAEISASAKNVISSLRGLRNQSDSLVKNKNRLNASLKNMEKVSDSLSKNPVVETVSNLQGTVRKAGQQTSEVTNSETINGLLNEKATYNKAAQQIENLNKDLKETKENPSGITLIGGD